MNFGAREFVMVSLMVGLLVAAWWFGFKKVDERKAALATEQQRKQAQLVELRESTRDVEDLGQKIDELQQAIEFFEDKLPQEKEVDKVLKEVWQMAQANRLQTTRVKTLKTVPGPLYNEQPINMSLSGDFDGFYLYLQALEKLPRITRVTQMNLRKINGREGEMEAELTLSVYFEPSMSIASAQ